MMWQALLTCLHILPNCQDITVRGDDRDHATGSQDESAAFGLGDGVLRFLPDLVPVRENDAGLTHAAADRAAELLLRSGEGGRRFAVVPVDDRKKVIRE